jgi:(2R)-3-sulfolactate dehydrogenase (NADP+)
MTIQCCRICAHSKIIKVSNMPKISVDALEQAVTKTLVESGASYAMASATARALVLAEAQGIASHGLARVVQYAAHLRNGRAVGGAKPTLAGDKAKAAFVVDAQNGLAFEACEFAVAEAMQRAKTHGIALAGVIRSHHCGVLVDHLRAVATQGMVGLAMTNSPGAMPMAGGKRPIFGTNPIAAIFPRGGKLDPLMIDLSMSEVARGKVMMAKNLGKKIPLGWALDANGVPTTDPAEAMSGLMLPLGASTSAKGAMLALVVEIMVSALIGSQFSYEASTFFDAEGNQPGSGQTFMVIDPGALAGQDSYYARLEELIGYMATDAEVRLPGERRLVLERLARVEGVEVSGEMLDSLG